MCRRPRIPWGVTSVNMTMTGPVLAVENQQLVLNIVGPLLPRLFAVQLQTTSYTTHNGPEGMPTHCTQTKPRNPILFNVSVPAVATNITTAYKHNQFCNGTCSIATVTFPKTMQLTRGYNYSLCFFFPYDYQTPKTSDEFRWDLLPDLYVQVAEARTNYYAETCSRHQELVQVMYYDRTQTDAVRAVESPFYFSGPIEPLNFNGQPGLKP